MDEIEVPVGDDTLVGENLKIHDSFPIVLAIEDDWDFLHAICLAQGECVEQLVQGSEPTWKYDQGLGSEQKVHLS